MFNSFSLLHTWFMSLPILNFLFCETRTSCSALRNLHAYMLMMGVHCQLTLLPLWVDIVISASTNNSYFIVHLKQSIDHLQQKSCSSPIIHQLTVHFFL